MCFATVGCQCCLGHYDLSKSKKVSNIILPTRAQGLVKETNRSVDIITQWGKSYGEEKCQRPWKLNQGFLPLTRSQEGFVDEMPLHLFIRQVIPELLLCARHCSR